MTIDEQIEFCKEKIKNIKLNTKPSIFENIKESLDELERYRKDYAWAERRAYKKALDDFIEKMNEQSEIARPVGWSSRIEIITMSTVRSIKEELMERRLHRMKIVEKYKCDVCGTEYKDRNRNRKM